MVEIVHIEAAPAQYFTVRFGDETLDFLFQYNLTYDYWSYSIFPSDDEDACPIIAGVELVSGRNLLENILDTHRFVVSDRPGIDVGAINNYYRFTQTLQGSQYPITFLAKATIEEIAALALADQAAFPAC